MLSKSTFVRSVQCLKSLYLYKNYISLRDPISKEKQAVFKRGNQIGILAQSLFPGGVDASPASASKYAEAVEKTKNYIDSGEKIIYEAAFMYDGVLVMIDMLVWEKGKWKAYEVKSSTRISSVYVMDACLQYFIIKNCIPDLDDILLITINSSYVLKEKLDLWGLFKITSLKADAEKNELFFKDRIVKAKRILEENKVPEVPIGAHCFMPYDCDFIGHCWKKLPAGNIFELGGVSRSKQYEWYKKGLQKIEDLSAEGDISDLVKLQMEVLKTGNDYFDSRQWLTFFNSIQFPLGFLDIEVAMPVIPVYEATQPFQQIPFLFSLHGMGVQGAEPSHYSYLAELNTDPRRQFAVQLIEATLPYSQVLVFDDQLEKNVINRLKQEFPELKKELEHLLKKLVDFAVPFQQLWYYSAGMKGSFSLKNILPALCNDQSFSQLPINSGVQAMYAWMEIQQEPDVFRVSEVKEQLKEYCQTDTLALMKIFNTLKSRV